MANDYNSVKTTSPLIWVDLEMTGLDSSKDLILEMACLVTDSELNILDEGLDLVIHQPDDVLASMNDWCIKNHGESGLTQRVRESNLSVRNVEEKMLKLIQKYVKPKEGVLCGNTIHMDKRFLDVLMPSFSGYLHYRLIDVSSIKELCRRWYPQTFDSTPPKNYSHRALEDIKDSLAELKFYKANIFK